jgi:hypothetical protein
VVFVVKSVTLAFEGLIAKGVKNGLGDWHRWFWRCLG